MQNKYRFYTYDFLIGQHLLTIDTQEKKYRIDCFNIHGQCSTLDRDWKRITKATINRALNRHGYVIDAYFLQHFYDDSKQKADMKELLFKANNFNDCILFLANYGKENHNYTDNPNHDYYKKYLEKDNVDLEENSFHIDKDLENGKEGLDFDMELEHE